MVSIPPHPLHVEYQRQMYAAPEYDGLEQGEIGEAYTLAINAIQHELAEAYTLRIAS